MELYNEIKKQRQSIIAPIDTMGCYIIGQSASEDTRRFQILVSLLLSSQTKDEISHAAVKSMNETLGVLAPRNVLDASEEDLHRSISRVGFHKKKLVFLTEISRRVLNGMPDTLEDVLALPGIGKKMAYLYLQHACGKSDGIGVDTHVHRISNRIGLVNTKTPEKTEVALQKVLDVEEWSVINGVLVGFGQTICKSVRPECEKCCVVDRCPYYQSRSKSV